MGGGGGGGRGLDYERLIVVWGGECYIMGVGVVVNFN